ncbi:MAG: VWA domain-containing protein, partial [Planctomycetota bacterium]|nr:VWA domain-containing protein [Planctomycetota bacterium]
TGTVAIDTGKDTPAPGEFALDAVVLEEIIDEREERRREIKTLLDKEEDWKERAKLQIELHSPTPEQMKKFGRTYGISTLLHVIVIVILSLIVFKTGEKLDGGAIISSVMGDDELVEEAAELPQEVKIENSTESQVEVANAADPAGALSNNVGSAADLSAFSGANVGGGLEGFSDALGSGADKMTGAAEKTSASFFGSKQLASSFVFVIDNSLSMTRGRFETALNELAKTVMALNPQQSYYIIFYSDTAYGLFHPQTARNLIPATPRNKQLTLQWLTTVELCLKTDFAEALQMAYFLDPDVIFLLGDGGFTDEPQVRQVFASLGEKMKRIKIHSLGMELDQRGIQNFKALSDPTGGTYRDVGIHPLGAQMAQSNPRRRNNKRGPIWGIKLK